MSKWTIRKNGQRPSLCNHHRSVRVATLSRPQGLKAYAEKEFDEHYNLLRLIRKDWNQSLSGSRAQVDILNQVLVQAGIKSGNRHGAKQLLERLSTCGVQDSENPSFHSRLQQKIQTFLKDSR